MDDFFFLQHFCEVLELIIKLYITGNVNKNEVILDDVKIS